MLGEWARNVGALLLRAVVVTVAVVVLAFTLLRVMPGSTVAALLGGHATEALKQQLMTQLGLDRPWWEQLGRLFGELLTHGDVGPSLVNGESVRSLILSRADVSLSIVLLAMLIAIVVSLVLAVAAAVNQNGFVDHALRVLLTAGIAIPAFWIGLLLILSLSVQLHWFPVAGVADGPWGLLRSITLPSITAAIGIIPVLARSLRAQLLEVMHADFVVAARAAGIGRARIVFRHLVPNASIPALTLVGTNFAYLVGGTFIVESVFSLPGIGDLMFRSIASRDSTTIVGIVIYTALLVVVVNLLTDLVVRFVDPRLNRKGLAL